ncbi:MAG: hypothetical protein ACI4L9_02305 [Candidatus Coproplasma sp.]
MEKDEKKRKKPAKSTPKKSAQPKKTTTQKPTAKKAQPKTTPKTPAKKPTTKANTPKRTKDNDGEPNYPKEFLKELEAAEKKALQARAEQERKACKKPAPAPKTEGSNKRTVEVPEGAKITDIRVHYKF